MERGEIEPFVMGKSLKGVIPILATPFLEDGVVDESSQLRLVDHLLEQGVHGLAAFGNAGEGYTLLPEERNMLLELIVKRVDGRVPVTVGVGATGTEAAVAACRQAEDMGADALMVLPPYLLKPDGDGVRLFYQAVSGRVQIPIMVQDAPLLTQVPMPPALLAKMAREIPGVKYAKVEAPPTAPKVSKVVEAAGADLTVFGGLNGQFMIEEISRGARGVMPAADMTSLYVEIWNRLEPNRRPIFVPARLRNRASSRAATSSIRTSSGAWKKTAFRTPGWRVTPSSYAGLIWTPRGAFPRSTNSWRSWKTRTPANAPS